MPRRTTHYPEKPWSPDPAKWAKFLELVRGVGKTPHPLQPKEGWQLWDWRTLEDKPQ